MPDLKFSCRHCQQHIQAEPGYAGMNIHCPKCNEALVVPGRITVATPPPPPLPAVVIQRPAAESAAVSVCPSCGTALAKGAVLCTHCGYNLATGQRLVAGRPAPLGKPNAARDNSAWYLTPYPYLGVLMLALGICYFLGKQNPRMMMAFMAVAVLYSLAIHLIVLVAAFKEGTGTGFLSLCIPFYALYFVFMVHDNGTLKVLYGVAFMMNVLVRFVNLA